MTEYQALVNLLKSMKSAVIGYSGGVDSTLLAKAATDALADNALCITISSRLTPADEIQAASALARELGFNQLVIPADPIVMEEVARNQHDRCYHCKLVLFDAIIQTAVQRGIEHVCDGTNADDANDFRPGLEAIRKLGVRSPLAEQGWTKARIRAVSQELGLPNWDRPSNACLASRLPYGTRITPELLTQVEKAESALRALGFSQLRVRHCGDTARIELMPQEMSRILDDHVRDRVLGSLQALGYTFVTVDLKGYRTGSLNESLDHLGSTNT